MVKPQADGIFSFSTQYMDQTFNVKMTSIDTSMEECISWSENKRPCICAKFRTIQDKQLNTLCALVLKVPDGLIIRMPISIEWHDTRRGSHGKRQAPPDRAAVVQVGTWLLALVLHNQHSATRQKTQCLDMLCHSMKSMCLATDVLGQMNDATRYGSEICEVAWTLPRWNRILFNALKFIGNALLHRFQRTLQLQDLDELISRAEVAVKFAQSLPRDMVIDILRLSIRLYHRFESIGNVEDLDRATNLSEQILHARSQSNNLRSVFHLLLCQCHEQKFERSGFWRDLEEAIRMSKVAFNLLLEGDRRQPALAARIAGLSYRRYQHQHNKNAGDFKEILLNSRQSVNMTPLKHDIRGKRLFVHMAYLRIYAMSIVELHDLNRFLEQTFEVLATMSVNAPYLKSSKELLVDILSRKYELSGLPSDLALLLNQIIDTLAIDTPLDDTEQESAGTTQVVSLRKLHVKVSKLATQSLDNNIVAQVSGAFHQAFLERVRQLGPTMTLIDIEENVIINAQVVLVLQESNLSDRQGELLRMGEFAASIGARNGRFRIKMPYMQLRPKEGAPSSMESETEVKQQTMKCRSVIPFTVYTIKIFLINWLTTSCSKVPSERFDALLNRYNTTKSDDDLNEAISLGISLAQTNLDSPGKAIEHLQKLILLLYTAQNKMLDPDKLHLVVRFTKMMLSLMKSFHGKDEAR